MTVANFVPSWNASAVTQALHALVSAVSPRPLTTAQRGAIAGSALASYAASLALEGGFAAEQFDLYQDDVPQLLSGRAPFLFVPAGGMKAYVVIASGRRQLTFLDAAGASVLVSRSAAEIAFASGHTARIDALVARIGPAVARPGLVAALRGELGAGKPLGWGFVLRPNVAESVPRLLRSLRVGRYAVQLFVLSSVQSLLTAAAWAVIGSLAISGHAETSGLLGWALLSVTATLLQVVAMRFVGRFTVRAATALRQRLLEGALRLEPDGLGAFGLGGLMVIASQTDAFLSSVIALLLALLGVFTNVLAPAAVLSVAPLASVTITGFVVFVLGILAAGPTLAKMLAAQQQERMSLTTDMVERMIGHRTRLVQQTLRSWHDGEDESVVTYGQNSRSVDRWTATLRALPRLYYVLSIVSLFFVIVSSPTQVALALSIGGMTLGMASLSALVDLVLNVGGLYALWSAIQPVVKDAAAQPTLHGARLEGAESGSASGSGTNVVELRGVRFGYPSRSRPVLDDVTLRIAAGERVLIEGPSGGGKTTLAALVTGMRLPDSGLVLVRGLDQHSIREDELRRVIASAPQFYKNHVFAGSLAFNLLLGRSWPPTAEDLREALGVARALGLGPMLSRMPAGIYQQVGATGWQLSHGEKSRVYLARTLLQRSELLVLDETFGALDPDTLKQCMDVVLERARTLVVITHR